MPLKGLGGPINDNLYETSTALLLYHEFKEDVHNYHTLASYHIIFKSFPVSAESQTSHSEFLFFRLADLMCKEPAAV